MNVDQPIIFIDLDHDGRAFVQHGEVAACERIHIESFMTVRSCQSHFLPKRIRVVQRPLHPPVPCRRHTGFMRVEENIPFVHDEREHIAGFGFVQSRAVRFIRAEGAGSQTFGPAWRR